MTTSRLSMTNTLLLVVFCCTLLFVTPSFTNAQNATSSDKNSTTTRQERREERRTQFEERTDRLRDAVASRTAATKEKVEAKREGLRQATLDRIQNLLSNMVRRMEAAIGRLGNITDRLTTRTEKIASKYEIDLDTVLSLIDDSKAKLNEATAIIENVKESTGGTLSEADPRAQFKEVKSAIHKAGNHIRSAHTILREAVAELKQLLRGIDAAPGVSEAVQANDISTTTEETPSE